MSRATGKAFAKIAEGLGLEGVVAKKTGSRYHPGKRSPDWRKIKLTNTQDCVILGWTPGQGGRAGTFGALLVGAYVDGSCCGSARSAPASRRRRSTGSWSCSDRWYATTPPIDDPDLAKVKGATFVEPSLVCEVEYLEITKSTHKMRAPSFKGLRDDKLPEDCVLERPRGRTQGS